jgi:hypothetical protein
MKATSPSRSRVNGARTGHAIADTRGDVETLIRQSFAGDDMGERGRRIGLSREQHIGAALLHVADEPVAGTTRQNDLDTVQRMRAVVREMME